jgi:drug/metabolite transporter (DMT)-like permease
MRNVISTPYLAWLSVCLIWGTTYLAIRVALESIPPALLGGLRWTAAGAALALMLRIGGQRLPARAHWAGYALLGLLMIGFGNGAVIFAEQWVPSGIAAVIIGAAPLWMVAIEAVLPAGERPSARAVLVLLIGFAGIVLLVWPDLSAGGAAGRQFAVGVVLLQIACLGWSAGSAYSRRYAREQNALGGSALQMVFAGLMMLMLATVRGEWRQLTFTARSLAAELYLTVFGSMVAYSAYVYALKHLPISTVSLSAYVNPLIAVCLGAVLLGEPFGPRIIVATGTVLLGIGVVRWRGKRNAAAPATEARPAA